MAKKERVLDPRIEQMANGLRAAGMRERNVYEALREAFVKPPSYRDLRASFDRAGLRYKADVAANRAGVERKWVGPTAERGGHYEVTGNLAVVAGVNIASSEYGERSAANRAALRAGRLSEAAYKQAQAETDRRFVVGYAVRAFEAAKGEAQHKALADMLNPENMAIINETDSVARFHVSP